MSFQNHQRRVLWSRLDVLDVQQEWLKSKRLGWSIHSKEAGLRKLTSTRIAKQQLIEENGYQCCWDVCKSSDSSVTSSRSCFTPNGESSETTSHIASRVGGESGRREHAQLQQSRGGRLRAQTGPMPSLTVLYAALEIAKSGRVS